MKRKILAITGIRSEYDILYPVLDAIQNHPNLDLELVFVELICLLGMGIQ